MVYSVISLCQFCESKIISIYSYYYQYIHVSFEFAYKFIINIMIYHDHPLTIFLQTLYGLTLYHDGVHCEAH